MRNKALFVGNGINRLNENGISWHQLVQRLKYLAHGNIDTDNVFKPFPFTFEEIVFKKSRTYHENTKTLKKKIKKELEKLPFNPIHRMMMDCKAKHIITTNYDYCLESSIDPDFHNRKTNLKSTPEEIHSLYRKYTINNKDIWHIHGEIEDKKYKKAKVYYPSQSIMMGFEHYAAYLAKIQKYYSGQEKDIQGLTKRLKTLKNDSNALASWVDLLFTFDTVICGFTFDFSETHLWWLLDMRQQLKLTRNNNISNTIKFYYINDLSTNKEGHLKTDKNNAITQVLYALGVECIPFDVEDEGDYKRYYEHVLTSEGL